MIINRNIEIEGSRDRNTLLDAFYIENNIPKPTIIFSHGYKGYKDWGAWNQMAQELAARGINVIKFNFSYNGGTVNNPIDFDDLEAFGMNNFSTEVNDLNLVIKGVSEGKWIPLSEMDLYQIFLLGHSRGGGISVIAANENSTIKGLITLASVADFGSRLLNHYDIEQWKKDGVVYVLNGRTHQQMPHYYQMYEDYINNEGRLTIKNAANQLKISTLVIHGENDEAVPLIDAQSLTQWINNATLKIISNTGHTFGASHPWNENTLPNALSEVIDEIELFITKKEL